MARKSRDVARERRWRDSLRQFARSGLGVRAFCRREKLVESAFYFWRSEIARRDGEIQRPIGTSRKPRLQGFLPIRVTDATSHDASIGGRAPQEASITLELAGGRLVRFPETIPAQRLAEIVAALEATCIVTRTDR